MLTLFFQDYLTIALTTPELDTQQDWVLTYSKEENGKTSLKFYRERNTTDQQNDTAVPVRVIEVTTIITLSRHIHVLTVSRRVAHSVIS